MSYIGITGMSFISGLGELNESCIKKIFEGDTGIKVWYDFEKLNLKSKLASRVDGFIPEHFDESASYCRLPKSFQYALYVVDKALKDARLNIDSINSQRIGIFYATGGAAVGDIERFLNSIINGNINRGSALLFPNTTSSVGCGLISIRYNVNGKCLVISSGGVAGIQAIEIAKLSIENDEIDIAIIVGSEEINETVYKAYYCTEMLANKAPNGDEKCRPYNKHRMTENGIVLGDGAAALILERQTDIKNNRKKPYAILSGTSTANNGMGSQLLKSNIGKGMEYTIKRALRESQISAEEVDLVIGAGNGNEYLDSCEQWAIESIFKNNSSSIPIITPSLIFGETVGPSTLFATICGNLMFEQQKTIPLKYSEDNEYKLSLNINKKSEHKDLNTILINGSSFYGDAASMVIKRV